MRLPYAPAMLLVLCVDLDDDIGRKTGVETPVVGRDAVEESAVALAEADPEDSDVNVLFEGIHIADEVADESVEVAAVTGADASDVAANRAVGEELDTVLAGLVTDETVRALVVTDGAQDESVLPVIRSRVAIDGVRRVVVRQAQDLESMYYTIKQVLDDPETRGTILIPLGILLLIYPLSIVADALDMPGAVFGVTSGLLGIYFLSRGLALGERLDQLVAEARSALFTGRVTVVTSLVAVILLAIGGVFGVREVTTVQAQASGEVPVLEVLAAIVFGSVQWFAAAGVTSSLGRVVDEYLDGEFEWEHLNAPVYVVAIAFILHGVARFALGTGDLSYLAFALTGATMLGLSSTFAFALAESRFGNRAGPT
jgi:putative membrane protein